MTDSDSTEHKLQREVVETRLEGLTLDDAGDLIPDGGPTHLLGLDTKKTIECTCGERFIKTETAIDHLKSVRDQHAQNETAEDYQ